MQIYKFGGSSINSIERIKQLASIVLSYSPKPLVLVITAMGKTTQALEKVTEAFYNGHQETALDLFGEVKKKHLQMAKYLLVTEFNDCISQLSDFFTEIEWLLHDKPVRDFDYYYDQIVSIGELLSSCIISHFLYESKINNTWLDVRDLIRTDKNFGNASIDVEITSQKIKQIISDTYLNSNTPGIGTSNIYVTQGFIGSTDDNENTTLGKRGGDYTAAIFANILNAESITIWKNVEGIMSAHPKLFSQETLIPQLNYQEFIEMAFYSAEVIHPKTIKPLQHKQIPLQVKCFLNPNLPGTTISNNKGNQLPPIISLKSSQVMLYLKSQDFSFISGTLIKKLYDLLKEKNLQPNLIHTSAITLSICLNDHPEKINQLALLASDIFDVQIVKQLSILTIQNYKEEMLPPWVQNKINVLTLKTKETFQMVYSNAE